MTSLQALFLIAGLTVLLLIGASFFVEWLRARGHHSKRLTYVEDRIASWWVILFIFILALIIGKYGIIVLFAFCAFSALREFLSLIEIDRGDHWALLSIMFVVLPLQFFFFAMGWVGMALIFIPVYAFLLLPMISVFRSSSTKHFLMRNAQYQWAMMLCIYCMSYLPALLFLEIEGADRHNILLLIYLIFVVEMARVFSSMITVQARIRKLMPNFAGSHKLLGFVGGAFASAILGAIFHFVTPFSIVAAFGLSLVVAMAGLAGVMVLAAIKRDHGVRSFDTSIAGHGGFLDGFSALLYAAPLYYHLVRFFWASY